MKLSPPTNDQPWQVHELTHVLTQYIDRLGIVWIEAQLAQLTLRGGSRTGYLTLRDTSTEQSVQAVASRSVIESCDPPLHEGNRIIIEGKIEFHPLRGSLQIRIHRIRHIGIGELLAKITQIRTLLYSEGLCDASRKKPLPYLPQTIGLITGKDSAAQKDILEIAYARWPQVRFIIINTLVQGSYAVADIIPALEQLDANPEVEVIIIARGGGSVEDLLPFSDETLCRAVAACHTPVISAIGHEPDHPVLDEVADLRAATPTDAAKKVVPDAAQEFHQLNIMQQRLNAALKHWVTVQSQLIDSISAHPFFTSPHKYIIHSNSKEIDTLAMSHKNYLDRILERKYTDIDYLHQQLATLSPVSILSRGYSIVTYHNHAVTTTKTLSPGSSVSIRFSVGNAQAQITALTSQEPLSS